MYFNLTEILCVTVYFYGTGTVFVNQIRTSSITLTKERYLLELEAFELMD